MAEIFCRFRFERCHSQIPALEFMISAASENGSGIYKVHTIDWIVVMSFRYAKRRLEDAVGSCGGQVPHGLLMVLPQIRHLDMAILSSTAQEIAIIPAEGAALANT
jgi:hypothetical protein